MIWLYHVTHLSNHFICECESKADLFAFGRPFDHSSVKTDRLQEILKLDDKDVWGTDRLVICAS